ncbi:PglL family O-oligosaccharyltransferase [Vogesella oryzae]|uniref:PglL family O-oligosaccharyltransferase n=1 Tax=Vogesella oryzae TaxID=1735285 RepID=UPI0015815043|nr:O-antigen ligase family protein [Vogesella oryzae]
MTLGLLATALLVGLLKESRSEWPRSNLWLLLWWLVVFVPVFLLQKNNLYFLPLSQAASLLVVIFAVGHIGTLQQELGREKIVVMLAGVILVAALLQAIIGGLQLMGMASLAHGYLVYAPGAEQVNIVGNIGQRNQLAQFLAWGVFAAAYLFAVGKLRIWLVLPSMLVLTLVMAWTGGRLPLAYAATAIVLAVVWFVRTGNRRLLAILVLGALFILLAQMGGHLIAKWLVGVDAGSGLDRLNDAGFGARRRIEWHKVFQVVQTYPWLGVGFGGFAYQSVWLEAFAGLDKIPENALFTHSHNLITQLLAETGVPATLLAAVAVTVCLLPFFKREQSTPENAFLILIMAAILGHSMFEYPLWYLPFTTMFFMVLALSPQPLVVIPVRSMLRKTGALFLAVGTFAYLWTGAINFFQLREAVFPVANAKANERNVDALVSISLNPFWSYEAELGLSNYLYPSRKDMVLKRQHFEQLAAYAPYPLVLTNLAILRHWNGEQSGAHDAVVMALATYPGSASAILFRLQSVHDASLQPLITMVSNVVQTRNQYGDKAAAEAATRGLPVRGPQLPELARFR